jgi:hypothetical protein
MVLDTVIPVFLGHYRGGASLVDTFIHTIVASVAWHAASRLLAGVPTSVLVVVVGLVVFVYVGKRLRLRPSSRVRR